MSGVNVMTRWTHAFFEKSDLSLQFYFDRTTRRESFLGQTLDTFDKPNLIFLDILLPGMDGITAVKKLKSFEETKDLPVIAISADAMPREIKKAMEAGFDHYITKPIKIPHLLKIVEEMIQKTLAG